MSAAGAPTRPQLRPGALPTDTTVRFVLLMLSVTTASLYLFQAIWLAWRGQRFAETVTRCAATEGSDSHLLGTLTAAVQRQTACLSGVSREQTHFAVAGALVVLAAAWVIYRLRPRWREHRSNLVPLSADSAAVLLTDVTATAAAAGLAAPPQVRVDAADPGVQAFVYGAGRDIRMGMTGGLVVQNVLDRAAFTAVLRHELGHVANRDIPWTYYTVSVWWAFLGIAVVPVVAIFTVRDPTYIARLGWRTALLALLVAVVSTGLLRTRETYADARAADWGSRADLERILAGQPAARRGRPAWLRTHPGPAQRRLLLQDSDGLFEADWLVALTAGVAAGTAFASLQDIAYLVLPNTWSVVLPAIVFAVPVAVVVTIGAWRVGLREIVRGARRPLGLPLGVGLGLGLAFAPLLTLQAAAGGWPERSRGWAGYVVWAVAMTVATVLVVRWVVDAGRLGVAAVVFSASPRRTLVGHLVGSAVVVAALLSIGSIALSLLGLRGPSAVPGGWLSVPMALGDGWLEHLPLLVVLVAVALSLATRQVFRSTWSDPGTAGGAGRLGTIAAQPFWLPSASRGLAPSGESAVAVPVPVPVLERPAGPPSLRSLALVGVLAATASTGMLVLTRIIGGLRDDAVRASDTFVLALGDAQSTALLAAAVVGSVVGALIAPGRWWSLGLLAGAVSAGLAGLGAVAVNVAAGCQLLPSVHHNCSAPNGGLLRIALLDPATRAAVPAFLLTALVGTVRALALASGRRVSLEAPLRGTAGLAAAGVAVVVAVALWGASAVGDVARVRPATVAGPGYQVSPSVFWHAETVVGRATPTFVTDTEDVTVLIVPAESELPPQSAARLRVGGRPAWPVAVQSVGAEEVRIFQVRGPGSVYLIAVQGTPANLDRRAEEISELLDSVRWAGTS